MVFEGALLIVDDLKSTITRATGRSVATSVFTDRTSATGKIKTKKEVQYPIFPTFHQLSTSQAPFLS